MSVKYKTKNIKTDGKEVFLVKINQTRANTNSNKNFKLTATRLNKVWLSGSLVCPFKNIISVIIVITEKTDERTGTSPGDVLGNEYDIIRYPAPLIKTFNRRSKKKYL